MKPPSQRGPQRTELTAWEAHTQQIARHLPYPSTPDIAGAVAARTNRKHMPEPSHRRAAPVWAAAILLALLTGLFTIPPVRAAILDFLQIGAVRIWLVEPTPSALPTAATPTPLRSLFNLAGATTLEEAAAKAGIDIRLPTTPADLGPPDGVFLQELGGPVVVLVWLDETNPEKAAYSLHIFGPDTLGGGGLINKLNPPTVFTTTVNGREAAWLEGPYTLAYGDGRAPAWESRYLVSGRVLLWAEDGLTYRLESNLSLEEAIQMAESLE